MTADRKARVTAQARAAAEARRLSGLVETGLSRSLAGQFALPAAEKLMAHTEALAERVRELHRLALEAAQ